MLRPAILPLRDVQMQPIEQTETYSSAEMQALAQHPEVEQRQTIAYDLRFSTNPLTLAILIDLLNDPDQAVQINAIRSIGLWGARRNSPSLMQPATQALLALVQQSHEQMLLDHGLISLGEIGDQLSIDWCLSQLINQPRSRLCAATALGMLKAEKARPWLLTILADPCQASIVRTTCIEALSQLAFDLPTNQTLIAALQDSVAEVREKAGLALCKLGDFSAFKPIWAYIRLETAIKPSQVAHALALFGDQAFEPTLAFLNDPDPNLRYWAALALGMFHDSRAIPALIALLNDQAQTHTRAVVATAARKSLNRLQNLAVGNPDSTLT
ncbi:PBS lyase HEAT domain protein repeat-containing protein [Herpetosiphon aurantiacus DSM 785]|uniref:PBS lyase HEAT domain protein repeat-containing protein n=2 Tax=Herpetosiphon TaxID=64 RepID=A9AZN1_HERA2|nr:PBS lyase HEAT domain protein repeat-containing protein [Herpetosiphon aurantiacus DSM 785]